MAIFDFLRRESTQLTQDKFASIVLKRMSNSKLFRELTYDPDHFCIRFKDSCNLAMTFNLHSVYKDYQKADHKVRLGVLNKYIHVFTTPSDMSGGEAALQNLMPVIRDKPMIEHETNKTRSYRFSLDSMAHFDLTTGDGSNA